MLGGTTGEYYAQSFDERIGLMSFCKERVNDRLPLIVGVGALRTEDAVELAIQAKNAGAEMFSGNFGASRSPPPQILQRLPFSWT